MRPGWLIRPEDPIPYGPANDAMHRLAERRLAGDIPDTVILLEHPPVFTAGRRAKPEELLWAPDQVTERGAEVHRIDRCRRRRQSCPRARKSTNKPSGAWWQSRG